MARITEKRFESPNDCGVDAPLQVAPPWHGKVSRWYAGLGPAGRAALKHPRTQITIELSCQTAKATVQGRALARQIGQFLREKHGFVGEIRLVQEVAVTENQKSPAVQLAGLKIHSGEQRFWDFIRLQARTQRTGSTQRNATTTSAPQGHSLAELDPKTKPLISRRILQGDLPRSKAFWLGGKLFLPHPDTKNLRWVRQAELPEGNSVVNGHFVFVEKNSIETMPRYPDDAAKLKARLESQGRRLEQGQIRRLAWTARWLNQRIERYLNMGLSLQSARRHVKTDAEIHFKQAVLELFKLAL